MKQYYLFLLFSLVYGVAHGQSFDQFIVEAMVDGKKSTMIFDNGADITIVIDQDQGDLAYIDTLQFVDQVSDGSTGTMYILENPKFIKMVGTKNRAYVFVGHVANLPQQIADKFDGVLGLNYISQFNWKLDLLEMKIQPCKERDLKNVEDYVILKKDSSEHVLVDRICFGEQCADSVEFLFDLGYNSVASYYCDSCEVGKYTNITYGISAKTDKVDTNSLDKGGLYWDDFSVFDIPIVMSTKPQKNLLGVGFLSLFSEALLLYDRGEIWLKPKSNISTMNYPTIRTDDNGVVGAFSFPSDGDDQHMPSIGDTISVMDLDVDTIQFQPKVR